MKKVSRFEALAKGLSLITTPIKKKQVANVIEKARLSSELALTKCNNEMEAAAAALINNPSEENLTVLADLIQKQEELNIAIVLAEKVKSYLEEEVDVDDEKRK